MRHLSILLAGVMLAGPTWAADTKQMTDLYAGFKDGYDQLKDLPKDGNGVEQAKAELLARFREHFTSSLAHAVFEDLQSPVNTSYDAGRADEALEKTLGPTRDAETRAIDELQRLERDLNTELTNLNTRLGKADACNRESAKDGRARKNSIAKLGEPQEAGYTLPSCQGPCNFISAVSNGASSGGAVLTRTQKKAQQNGWYSGSHIPARTFNSYVDKLRKVAASVPNPPNRDKGQFDKLPAPPDPPPLKPPPDVRQGLKDHFKDLKIDGLCDSYKAPTQKAIADTQQAIRDAKARLASAESRRKALDQAIKDAKARADMARFGPKNSALLQITSVDFGTATADTLFANGKADVDVKLGLFGKAATVTGSFDFAKPAKPLDALITKIKAQSPYKTAIR